MIIAQNLLFSLLILSLQHFFETSVAANSSHCSPSSCGILGNIWPPFRLKNDPNNCGNPMLELGCENNIASMYMNSQKYHMKAIDYINQIIRVADASINNHTCSFPIHSFHGRLDYPYPYYHHNGRPVNLMSCLNPLKNSSMFTDITTDCASHPRYTYVKVGRMKASEVPPMCEVDLIVMTSWEFNDSNNASLSEIHDSLLYGFELHFCGDCRPLPTQWEKFRVAILGYLPVLLFIVVSLVAGLSFPLTILAGLGFLSYFVFDMFMSKHLRIDTLIIGIAGATLNLSYAYYIHFKYVSHRSL